MRSILTRAARRAAVAIDYRCIPRNVSTKDLLNEAVPIPDSVREFTDGKYRIININEEEAVRLDDIVLGKDYSSKKSKDQGSRRILTDETQLKDEELFTGGEANANRIKGFLEMNPFVCHGCGSPFQSKTAEAPGFLPKEKMTTHQARAEVIRKEQETIKLLQQAGHQVGSSAAKQLLESAKISKEIISGLNRFSAGGETYEFDSGTKNLAGESSNNALDARSAKEQYKKEMEEEGIIAKCQRCFRLQEYGQIEESLRAGWSKNELLSPAHFQTVLKTISESNAVVLCLVDVFDLQGSILANLRDIAGDNPIVIAANKFDLLPKDVFKQRVHGL